MQYRARQFGTGPPRKGHIVRRLRTVFATLGIAAAVVVIAPASANAAPALQVTPVTSVTVVQPDSWGWAGAVSPDSWGWAGVVSPDSWGWAG